jgi:hypothetical protein
MAWEVKWIFDSVGTVLIAVGEIMATKDPVFGHVVAAVGVGVLAVGNYLFEKGIIMKVKAR